MTSVHLDAQQRRSLPEWVRRFPGVSVFDVDAVLTQVRQVAEKKMPDLNAGSLEAACRLIEGTARSMGLDVVD